MGSISGNTVQLAKVLFIEGATTTTVSRSLGISWTSAKNLAVRFQPERRRLCSCGKRINHRGRCLPRLESKVDERKIDSTFTSFPVIISDGSVGKCIEAACPYPAVANYKCRQHALDSFLPFSFLSSTLKPGHLFSFPEKNRVPRRSGCK